MTIIYIPGEDNCIAHALSCVADGAFPGETTDAPTSKAAPHGFHTMLSITTDPSILQEIQDGYAPWYIGDRLVIPRTGNIYEELFRLTHDNSGHFGTDKSYATLRDT